jgi:hypothetical protein
MDQFGLTDQAGVKMNPNGQAIEVKVSKDLSSSTPFEGGYAAKFHATEVGDLPVITPISSVSDPSIGVVLLNMQKSKRYANERVEFALEGSIVSMVAATAFNRGVAVSYDPSSNKISGTTAAPWLGRALDIASATGDIVRVLINPKAS